MPEVDALLGLSFHIYHFDNNQHKSPHIHVKYAEYELVFSIEPTTCLEGFLPNKQRKLAGRHMLKVIDVDFIENHTLELTFNDGFKGIANLSNTFNSSKLKNITDFKKFSLTAGGDLKWGANKIPATKLRKITKGNFTNINKLNTLSSIEDVIKQACWDSIVEKRPDILQAAIRSYVELYGHTKVINKAGIKSRTSAYKTLKPETKPTFATLVQLGNAVVEIVKDDDKVTN